MTEHQVFAVLALAGTLGAILYFVGLEWLGKVILWLSLGIFTLGLILVLVGMALGLVRW